MSTTGATGYEDAVRTYNLLHRSGEGMLTPGEAHQARWGAAQRDALAKIWKAMEEYRALVYASHQQYLTDTDAVQEAETPRSP